jgi:hypothetical protein
MQKLCTADC